MTDLVRAAGGETVALLGAGNCNDVELQALAGTFREIHLFDLDADAVKRARDRQPAEVARKLVLHAPVDFSGSYDRLPTLRSKPLAAAELEALAEGAVARVLAETPERFDTVLSACCLSQIMHSCFLALGKHKQLHAVAEALARVHVRVVLSLTRPGGQAMVASDVVSTETFPLEELWGQRPPLALLADIEQSQNYLSGTAPTFIRRLFTTDPVAAPMVAGSPRLIEPWLWRLGDEISFLVYALAVQRREAPPSLPTPR